MIASALVRTSSGLPRLLGRPRRFEIKPAGPAVPPTCWATASMSRPGLRASRLGALADQAYWEARYLAGAVHTTA
jgi:hypothetical protein